MKRSKNAPPASMKDVAKAAGVAVSTVSRALGTPGRINKETADKIKKAAASLNYTMNSQAQGLRLGRSRSIMVILPEQGTLLGAAHVVSRVLQGIDQELINRKYNLIVSNFSRSPFSEANAIEMAYSGLVQGAIVISSAPPEFGARSLLDSGIAVVSAMYDLEQQGIVSVTTAERPATATLVRHMSSLGHRKFLYVSGPASSYHDVHRFAGVHDGLAGLEGQVEIARFEGDYTLESGAAAVDFFLQLPTSPTAIICANDDMALAFMARARARGIRIPEDVSVTGFDGAEIAAFSEPSLTTIKQPTEKIGRTAAQLLLRLIDGSGVSTRLHCLEPELVLRSSVAGAPVKLPH